MRSSRTYEPGSASAAIAAFEFVLPSFIFVFLVVIVGMWLQAGLSLARHTKMIGGFPGESLAEDASAVARFEETV